MTIVAFLLSSCAKERIGISGSGDGPVGEVAIALSARSGHQNAAPVKSEFENAPEAEAFEIEIFNSKGVRLYRDSYANTAGRTIPLNAGEYRLLAQYGDSAGVGFDVVYFAADLEFVVEGQKKTDVQAVAKMANAKIAVNFGENLKTYYPEHYARVKHPDLKDYLEFSSDETRAGYIPAGDLILEIYAKEDGVWKYYRLQDEKTACAPNDFMTFNVDVDPREGGLQVGIIVSDEVETVDKGVMIPQEAAPTDAPQVVLSGFEDNGFDFIEAVGYEGVQADFVVPGGIAECTMTVTSSAGAGLPSTVDLVNADGSVTAQFEAVGIRWNADLEGKRLGSLDFSGLGKNAYDPDNIFMATFQVTVVDKAGKSVTSDPFVVTQSEPVIRLNAAEGNAFAKRIEGLTAEVIAGNPAVCELQYSRDGSEWTPVEVEAVDGQTVRFGKIPGLEPQTSYSFRTVYNGNSKTVKEAGSLTTEEAAQIGNSGFEYWYEWEYTVYNLWPKAYQKNYGPYVDSGAKFWDTNNSETTPSNRTISNYTFKSFPTVSYVAGRNGSGKAAQIMTIAISNTATSGSAPDPTVRFGRLFTGEYGGTEEVAFPSRPGRMSFHYKYSPCETDSFSAKVYVKNGGTVIGEGSFSASSASDWTPANVEITYSRTDLKARSIHVEFVSGTETYDGGDPHWAYNVPIVYGGSNTANVHGGSTLTVDDLALIYE